MIVRSSVRGVNGSFCGSLPGRADGGTAEDEGGLAAEPAPLRGFGFLSFAINASPARMMTRRRKVVNFRLCEGRPVRDTSPAALR